MALSLRVCSKEPPGLRVASLLAVVLSPGTCGCYHRFPSQPRIRRSRRDTLDQMEARSRPSKVPDNPGFWPSLHSAVPPAQGNNSLTQGRTFNFFKGLSCQGSHFICTMSLSGSIIILHLKLKEEGPVLSRFLKPLLAAERQHPAFARNLSAHCPALLLLPLIFLLQPQHPQLACCFPLLPESEGENETLTPLRFNQKAWLIHQQSVR